MKKSLIYIVGIILIVIAFFVFLHIRQNRLDIRPFNKLEFNESIQVHNYSSHERLDTICFAIADHIFKLNDIDIQIYDLPPNFSNLGDLEIQGIAQKLPYGKDNYIIFLAGNLSFESVKTTLVHEFIHINQYYYNKLAIIGSNAIYEGRNYDLLKVKYEDRPFEKEAFDNQAKFRKILDTLLYE